MITIAGGSVMADTKGIVRKRHRFLFIAPDANEVCMAGSFNQWDPEATPMKKRRDGTWYAVVYLSPGRYEYRIVVDGIWTDDPNCPTRRPNQYGGTNCIFEQL